MRVFSYVVAVDSGFSPNPFWGTLTLACCKPKIRLTAVPGDIIVGISRASRGHGVIFVAKVDQKLTFREFWADSRFRRKRPRMSSPRVLDRCGDNIYQPTGPGQFNQLLSGHSFDDAENPESKARDLTGRFVLTSKEFSYFGRDAIPLPKQLRPLIVGRAHRCRFPEALVEQVDQWRMSLPRGVNGQPAYWPNDDRSWRACG